MEIMKLLFLITFKLINTNYILIEGNNGGMKVMSDKPKDGKEKKGYWKRQTLTAKILLIFGIIFLIGIIAVVGTVVSQPVYTDLNVTSGNASGSANNHLTINGTTEPGATIQVNNISVTPDSNGKFSYQFNNIPYGTTLVDVVAKVSDKQPSIATFNVTRVKENGGIDLSCELINQTDVELIG
jgi:hypothetical protein